MKELCSAITEKFMQCNGYNTVNWGRCYSWRKADKFAEQFRQLGLPIKGVVTDYGNAYVPSKGHFEIVGECPPDVVEKCLAYLATL